MMNFRNTAVSFFLLVGGMLNLTFGQFTFVNTLKTSDESGLKIGNDAYLTALKGKDVIGEGYLRLTEAKGNQRGYMFVKQSFPSTMGLTVDFEFTNWRDVNDSYFGADGFTLFLFDGSVSESEFALGGWGGSLGYATFVNSQKGLTGGYVGIGFDSYGNFIRADEGRNGGQSAYAPNSIVLRGPTRSVLTESNRYLTSALLGNRTGLSDTALRQINEIDYNTVVSSRPSSSVFYRRVQVSIARSGSDYVINLKWRKENQTTFTNLITYTMSSATYPLPSTLKVGFAGGTGGGFNYQEIRNLVITTPGNLRLDNRLSNSFVCNGQRSTVVARVEVTNDSNSSLPSFDFNAVVKDSNGNALDLSKFEITNISSTGFTSSTIPTQNFSSNSITGIVGLAAKSSGIVTITGNYKKGLATNSNFIIESIVDRNQQLVDQDRTNNTTISKIDIRKCSVMSNPSLPTTYK